MEKTLISYCDSTVNFTRNCVGCELWNGPDNRHCYAGRMEERWRGRGAFDKPVELLPGRLAKAAAWSDLRGTQRAKKPWLNGLPRVIFAGDMADTLSPDIPFDYLVSELIQTVTSPKGSQHIWLWLTKQSHRLLKFDQHLLSLGMEWPENLVPGVTLTSQKTAGRARNLLQVRARTKWLSLEPMLGPISIGLEDMGQRISWVVCGGESGPGARPMDVDWARQVRYECVRNNVPFYFKQWGEHNQAGVRVGRQNTGEMLDDIEWRQMPRTWL